MSEDLNKKQRAAISRLERSLKACFDAGLLIFGMDDDLCYCAVEAVKKYSDSGFYSPHADAYQANDPCAGQINHSRAYRDSGGW